MNIFAEKPFQDHKINLRSNSITFQKFMRVMRVLFAPSRSSIIVHVHGHNPNKPGSKQQYQTQSNKLEKENSIEAAYNKPRERQIQQHDLPNVVYTLNEIWELNCWKDFGLHLEYFCDTTKH